MTRPLPPAGLILAFLVLPATPVAAQLTGTLFTSPAQREYLDYLRQDFLASSSERGFDITEAEIPEIPTAVAEAEAAGPEVYTLGGIVSLRDGTQRIWLNGKALSEAELPPEADLVRDNGMLALRFSTANGTYLLRPGQTLDLAEGLVLENYQRSSALEPAEQPGNQVEQFQTSDPTPVPDEAPSLAMETSEIPIETNATPEQSAAMTDADQSSGIDTLQARLEALENVQFGQDDDE